MKIIDYHIHSGFIEHTHGSLSTIIKECKRNKYTAIAITEHFSPYFSKNKDQTNLKNNDTLVISQRNKLKNQKTLTLNEYLKKINNEKTQNHGLTIFSGIELDYFKIEETFTKKLLKKNKFDIINGSCHHIKDPLTRKYVHVCDKRIEEIMKRKDVIWIYKQYYNTITQMAKSKIPTYVSHINFIKRKIQPPKKEETQKYLEKSLKIMVKNNIGLEINLKGIKNYNKICANDEVIETYLNYGGNNISIGSDSHSILDIQKSRDLVKQYSIKYQKYLR